MKDAHVIATGIMVDLQSAGNDSYYPMTKRLGSLL
jgi:hypothetical protein